MAIIGGYYSFCGQKLDPVHIASKLKTFQYFSQGSPEQDDICVHEYPCGHLFTKGRKDVRGMISTAKMEQNRLFVSLGYLTMNDWKDWNTGSTTWQAPQHPSSSFAQELTQAEGEFTAIYWDNPAGKLHFVNDRFAARPLYILRTSDTLFFCSNLYLLVKIAGHKVKLDPIGLMQSLVYHHTVDVWTHVESVQRLKPGSHWVVSGKEVQSKQYWKLKFDVDYDLDPREHAKAVFSAFRKSVSDRAAIIKKGILTISGGLDSRLIAGCIPNPADFSAITVVSNDEKSEMEYLCASEICRTLGFSHQKMDLPAGAISDMARDTIPLTGGILGVLHSILLMQGFGSHDMCFGGSPGDVLAGTYIPNLFYTLPSKTEEILRSHKTIQQTNSLREFFTPEMVNAHLPRLNKIISDTYDDIPAPTAAHKFTAWIMIHYLPAFSCATALHCHPRMSRVYPHFGYAYNDLFLKVPALWLYGKKFYKYMIYQGLPEIRHVLYANTGEYLKDEVPPTKLPLLYYKFWALRRRLKAKFGKPTPPTPQMVFQMHLIRNDEKLWEDMNEIWHSYPALHDYFNWPNWTAFWESIRRGDTKYDIVNAKEFMGTLAAILYFYKFINEDM